MAHVIYQSEERARSRKKLEDESILLARESRWEEAAAKNREILSFFPRDVSTLNRLGKALSELGQYAEAKKTYTETLELDPANGIARKNLERLAQVRDEVVSARTVERADPRLFIEEPGKTGFTDLVDLAPSQALLKVGAGDQVYLRRDGTSNLLYVHTAADERIGRVEPRLASRLIKFMEGGNQYAAGVTEADHHSVRLIIKETFQDSSLFGRVSFPTQHTGGETIRPYIKDSMLRYDRDEDDEFGEDGEFLDEGDDEEAEGGDGEDVELEVEAEEERL
jgi:tetratricopeptide (TPR) repeat protein